MCVCVYVFIYITCIKCSKYKSTCLINCKKDLNEGITSSKTSEIRLDSAEIK